MGLLICSLRHFFIIHFTHKYASMISTILPLSEETCFPISILPPITARRRSDQCGSQINRSTSLPVGLMSHIYTHTYVCIDIFERLFGFIIGVWTTAWNGISTSFSLWMNLVSHIVRLGCRVDRSSDHMLGLHVVYNVRVAIHI